MKEEDKTYLDQLNKSYLESSSQFDKQILYFASGALGLSFAFIKDIVKLNEATNKGILVIAWSFFILVILLGIISHYTSLKAVNKKIQHFNLEDDGWSQKLNSITKWLNFSMIVILSLGLISLTIFIAINI